MDRIWKMSLMIAALVIIDQVTKGVIQKNFYLGETVEVIGGFFNLNYVQNTGAAFGFMAGAHEYIRKPLFIFMPILACFWLVWLIWTSRKESFWVCFSYSLILAGAIGNILDRVLLGYVVDFLDFHFRGSHFPSFNVADMAITIAAGILIIDQILEAKRPKKVDAKS